MLVAFYAWASQRQKSEVIVYNDNTTAFDGLCDLACAVFLRIGKFTYAKGELANCKIFSATKLTRSDITFSQNDQYAVLRLKKCKTDIKHAEAEIIIAATNHLTCLVSDVREIFMLDPQSSNATLFSRDSGVAFARNPSHPNPSSKTSG